jgi:hypothetical protein
MQVGGEGFRIARGGIYGAGASSRSLEDLLHRSVYLDNAQSRQLAACNARHELVERLARWLLMCDDRVHVGGIFARGSTRHIRSLTLSPRR